MKAVDRARREALLSAAGPGLGPGSAQGPGLGPSSGPGLGQGLGQNNEVSLSEPLSLTAAYDRLSLMVACTVALGEVLGDKNRATYREVTRDGRNAISSGDNHGLLEDHNTKGRGDINSNGDTSSKTGGDGGSGSGDSANRDPTVGYRCCDVLSSVEQVRVTFDRTILPPLLPHHTMYSNPSTHPPHLVTHIHC